MVRLIFWNILCFISLLPISAFAQQWCDTLKKEDEPQLLAFALESTPEYKGGGEGLINFIKSHTDSSLLTDEKPNKVFIAFWVDKTGLTFCHYLLKGINKKLNEEALRVARLIKFEKPAMQAGKPVRVRFTLPIDFNRKTKRKRF